MRLLSRRRGVPVEKFDAATRRWVNADGDGPIECDELTLTTYNVWNDTKYDKERYLTIAQLLSRSSPDVMVFQEVTPTASDVLLSQDWIRGRYFCAAVVGGDAGDYGMVMLSRLPISRVTYARLPWSDRRGFLQAELPLNGGVTVVCCLHLDSGKASARLRGWQLRRIFRDLRGAEDAVVLGDFNMRDAENARIGAPYRDVWPALRPGEDGFTEDTSENLMLADMKDKHRHVRFDRVLLKGEQWAATNIELLGTEPIADDLPRVFPSDHFGVECRLTRRNP